jgi:RNA polymerase sigma factor (sigma-70 family)
MEPEAGLGRHRDVNQAITQARVVIAAGPAREAFDDFYAREYDRSVRLAWLLTGSRAAAEDVVQDAMTAVFRTFDRLDVPAAYLRRAVVNTANSRHRDERRRAERLTLLERERPLADPSDAGLLDLIGRLPYRQRVVIVGRYWGGWSEAEIAHVLGCRPGTVKSLASRALKTLRKEVQE